MHSTTNIIMLSVLIISFCMLVSQITCLYSDNYSLYEVTAFNYRERALLYILYIRHDNIVFLNGVTNQAALPMNIVVGGCCTKFFEDKMRDNDIEYVKVPKENLTTNKWKKISVRMSYSLQRFVPNLTTEFHRWDRLMLWVDYKLQKFSILKKIHIATTFEKREVFVLKISTGRKNTAVFIMGGEEGKDWLSPAILLNFISYILEHQLHLEQLIKHYDIYVLPIMNPDGYEYSITKDIYWTQNRKLYFTKKMCPKNETTMGINLDRNWFFSKDVIRNEECDPIYSGSKALSELETAGLAKFLNTIAPQMLVFINVRSFDYLITIPYGNSHEISNNYPILKDILSSVHDRVVEEHNRNFFYGTTAHYYFNFTGNVADWVKQKLNTPVVYTLYMKKDFTHFFPSAKDIQPLTRELSTMIKEILLLANSIYSPLFSHQIRHSIPTTALIINIVCVLLI